MRHMMELILATGNRHKIIEITIILADIPVKLISKNDLPDMPEVVEDGETLEENAAKKAREIALKYGKWALADDSGLEVDALKGAPGVFSARWAGPGCTYSDNNRKLIKLLKDIPNTKRRAKFRSVIALSNPEGKVWCVEGSIRGIISKKTVGKNGFGYDPVFVVPGLGETFAQLPSEIKNKISHRALALNKARKMIVKAMLA